MENMAKKKTVLIRISERALVARIQRKLKADGQQLRKCRHDTAGYNQLGQFFIVDQFDAIVSTHHELATLGKELNVLKPYEKLED
jgi:hypothetical protein